MEFEIYNIIKKIAYEQSIKKLFDESAHTFEYPIKIEKITFDMIDIFNNSYFNMYRDCLLNNAAIFAIKSNDKKYIDLFNNKNIKLLIRDDRVIKAMITQRAFYNINEKIKKNINNDDEIIKNNKELYNKLTNCYKVEFITSKIRKIILSFINNFDTDNYEMILETFLESDKLDKYIMEFNNFINDDNIDVFKNLLFKIILSDNYLYLKSLEQDIKDDELDLYEDDYINDEEIINLLENDNIQELSNYNIRLSLYTNFIVYNALLGEQKEDYKNIMNNKESIKTLKKINPLYMLDLF